MPLLGNIANQWLAVLGMGKNQAPQIQPGENFGEWLDYILNLANKPPSDEFLFDPQRMSKPTPSTEQFLNNLNLPGLTVAKKRAAGEFVELPLIGKIQTKAPGGVVGKARSAQQAIAPVKQATTTIPKTVAQLSSQVIASNDWLPQAQQLAAEFNVPIDVVRATIDIESGGNPRATSPMNYDEEGKPIGRAKGLMQVMPFHFATGEDPYDVGTNLRRGIALLAQKYAQYGDWDKAAAAYFGAIDNQGNITGAKDVGGVSGHGYVQKFRQARSKYAISR